MNRDRRIGRLATLAWLVAMGIACEGDDAGRGGLPGDDETHDDGAGVGGKADETGPGAFSVVRRVAVVNYNPTWVETNSNNIRYKSAAQLANEYIQVVRQASHGALEYRLADITDANFAGGWAELDHGPPNLEGVVVDEALWHQCRGEAKACAAIVPVRICSRTPEHVGGGEVQLQQSDRAQVGGKDDEGNFNNW